MSNQKLGTLSNLKSDIPAGVVVFLVAVPLCLGIALASGAPLFSGIIAGIVGGIVVGFASGSQLSVSGPAAGLTVIVLNAIENLGTFESFILAVVIAGIIQVTLGVMKAGIVGHYFPSSVIKGMLAAIGLILILKQIPHALGDDKNYEGDEAFFQADGENTFTEIILAFQNISEGAIIISVLSILILVLWERPFMKKLSFTTIIPGPLIVVIFGILLNRFFLNSAPHLGLTGEHLVSLPVPESIGSFFNNFTFPDFGSLLRTDVYVAAITIALIASLETLLSLDAVDKLDPYRRIAPQSRELIAQGLGNMTSGLIGGLPITAVIVRSSANVASGAKTKASAIIHGVLLITSVMFLPKLMNMIPLASLAAILLSVGFKLTKPTLFKSIAAKGNSQFIPFIITILAILFTDLLKGISVGIMVGIFYVVKTNLHQALEITIVDNKYTIKLNKDVSFLSKAFLRKTLEKIPAESHVTFDGSKSVFVDNDIIETIQDYEYTAEFSGITIEYIRSADAKVPFFRSEDAASPNNNVPLSA